MEFVGEEDLGSFAEVEPVVAWTQRGSLPIVPVASLLPRCDCRTSTPRWEEGDRIQPIVGCADEEAQTQEQPQEEVECFWFAERVTFGRKSHHHRGTEPWHSVPQTENADFRPTDQIEEKSSRRESPSSESVHVLRLPCSWNTVAFPACSPPFAAF